MSNPITLTLKGWVHVHTYQESHGNYSDYIYQEVPDPTRTWDRQVKLLHVTVYHDSMYGSAERTSVRTESGKLAHDYLLAREIEAKPERYTKLGDRQVSPCYTAGADDYEDQETKRLYRITSVAGHGAWAFEIQPEDRKIKEW